MNDPWHFARRIAIARGQQIRRLRTLAGLTQSELADLLQTGLDASVISRIEGGFAIPTGLQAVRLGDWVASQTGLQTSDSDATGVPALSYPIVTPTPPRATHPDTSRRAMDSVNRETAWAIHDWVIEMLTDHPEGATHEQLWMLYVRLRPEARTSQSGLRTRVSELVRGGVVRDSGTRRRMSTGRQAIVWELA